METEWTKGRMLQVTRQRTNKPDPMRGIRTFCAMRSCQDGSAQFLDRGENEPRRTPFPIAFSTLHPRAYV